MALEVPRSISCDRPLRTMVHGEASDFRILAHVQPILDTGIGDTSDPQTLLSLQLALVY